MSSMFSVNCWDTPRSVASLLALLYNLWLRNLSKFCFVESNNSLDVAGGFKILEAKPIKAFL
jgi:hypothetical protein